MERRPRSPRARRNPVQLGGVDRRRVVRHHEPGNSVGVTICVYGVVVLLSMARFATVIRMARFGVGMHVCERSTHREEEVGEQHEPSSG